VNLFWALARMEKNLLELSDKPINEIKKTLFAEVVPIW
jgi:methylthioribose-1-phosphate isomerase